MSTARLATVADLDRLCRTATRAFVEDPLIRWMVPDLDTYLGGQGERLFRSVFRWWGELGEVWTTEDGVAVAAWGPPVPGVADEPLLVELGELTTLQETLTMERGAVLGESMRAHRPAEPHWYLNVLATHPDWQRQGLGMTVMADVRRRCDLEGYGQYLETATDDDIAYYRGRGFEVTEAWVLDDTVTLTGMWRAPGHD